jgi:hypothetical protein
MEIEIEPSAGEELAKPSGGGPASQHRYQPDRCQSQQEASDPAVRSRAKVPKILVKQPRAAGEELAKPSGGPWLPALVPVPVPMPVPAAGDADQGRALKTKVPKIL